MLAAGRLRHRITIQRPVYEQDLNTGAMNPVIWQEVAKVYAAIEPLSTRDFIAAQAEQSKIIARIIIRYREGITADMRALHNGKIYVFSAPLADKDSGLEYLTIPVSEGVRDV
ncbi:phage head closure protein [Larkinella harenae]